MVYKILECHTFVDHASISSRCLNTETSYDFSFSASFKEADPNANNSYNRWATTNQISKTKDFPVFVIAVENILLLEFPNTKKYGILLERKILWWPVFLESKNSSTMRIDLSS